MHVQWGIHIHHIDYVCTYFVAFHWVSYFETIFFSYYYVFVLFFILFLLLFQYHHQFYNEFYPLFYSWWINIRCLDFFLVFFLFNHCTVVTFQIVIPFKADFVTLQIDDWLVGWVFALILFDLMGGFFVFYKIHGSMNTYLHLNCWKNAIFLPTVQNDERVLN